MTLDALINARAFGFAIGLVIASLILIARIWLSEDPSARWAFRGLVGGRGRRRAR